MPIRRTLVVLIVLLVSFSLSFLAWPVLAPGGWTIAKIIIWTAFAGTTPWTGLCVANGSIGFLILVCCRDPVKTVFPSAGQSAATAIPNIAIAVPVRNEDIDSVARPLARLMRELAATTSSAAFTLFILSDSQDPMIMAQEERAVAALRDQLGDPGRVRYRRRATNTGFKAGNIMDFLDHHAEGYTLMLLLDADSDMSASAVLRLVHAMQTDPTLGIVQHLTVGLPAPTALPRLFQFGMRAGMRTWAVGQAWWQGDEGPFWGHNALIRIAPFRDHCRLPLLPSGRPILSHDQVEAALLRGAGWGVRVLPVEDGSREANPPALPEFLHREIRWLTGNLQYRHLLRLPGLRPMGRWQLVQAILLFSGPPLYLLIMLAASLAAATDFVSPFPAARVAVLVLAWFAALFAPKLLGYAELALSPAKRARYGGLRQLTTGVVAEIGFTFLLDAISTVSKTIAMIRLAIGSRASWPPQNRASRGVAWSEAVRLLWPHTVIGVAIFAGFAVAGWAACLWAVPFAAGLPLSIPFCVLTADRRVGQWMQRQSIAAIPEEINIPTMS